MAGCVSGYYAGARVGRVVVLGGELAVGCCHAVAGIEVGVLYGTAEVSENAGEAGGFGEVPVHYGLGAERVFYQGAELCGEGLCGGEAAGWQGVGGGVGE